MPSSHQVLDPRTLGRPVHLLRNFTTQLREDLSDVLRTALNSRYRANFQVGEVSMASLGEAGHTGRWLNYDAPTGRIGYALERNVVLSALVYRYGLNGKEGAVTIDLDALPETATEERLAAMLGLQLVTRLAARIEAGLEGAGREAPVPQDFKVAGPGTPRRETWLIKATIQELIHGVEGNLCFALDDAWMALLLQNLASGQRKPRRKLRGAGPLPTRLHFTLVARLLQKDLLLGELLDLRIGDVIPVSLRATDVLVDDSRLFTAAVAEHKGKLCLTSFEDAE